MEARKQMGMRPEDHGPLPVASVRLQFKGQYGARIEAGIAEKWVQKTLATKRSKSGSFQPQRIPIGIDAAEQNLIVKVPPVYPALALQARIQGTVRFTATIGKDGKILNLRLVSGHPLLVAAAQDAAKQWIYKPPLLNGELIEAVTQLDVNFAMRP